jgi:hypothetical protein
VDSRYDLPRFRGATGATPNEPEVEALTGVSLDEEGALDKAGRAVLERLDARLLLVTRGSRGMALFERDGPVTLIPIHGSDQIVDVTGAGDTVISTFTVALAAGVASLGDPDQVENGRRLNTEVKKFVSNQLDSLGYKLIPSQANFIMFDTKRSVVPVIAALKERNVHVGRLFPALPNYMRLTIGRKNEMESFLSAFREVMV